MRKHLAARLLAERIKRGHGEARRFPQPEMARELGVSGRAYQGWEGEERLPSWRNLEKMADHFGTTTEDLLGSPVTAADLPPETEAEASLPADHLEEILDLLKALEAKVATGFEALEAAIDEITDRLPGQAATER